MATKKKTPTKSVAKAPEPEKPKSPVAPVIPDPVSAEKEMAEIHARMAADRVRLHELEHPIIPYPKWVNGIVVDNAEQEAAVLGGSAETVEIKEAGHDRVILKKGK